MVSHSQLQDYKHEYPKVCMTGVLGCRWHRYKQSKNGSTKRDVACFTFLLLTSLFVIFWFYSVLIINNDRNTLNEYLFIQIKKWISWYTIMLAVVCVVFSYIAILMFLSLCHIISGHQLYIHPSHYAAILLALALCVALTVVIEDLWLQEFDVLYISIQMFGPFIQIGAVCIMTALTWTISQEWNRISQFSLKVVLLLLFICVMIGLYISPLFIECPCIMHEDDLPHKPRLFGHRGDSSMAPENTVISFKQATDFAQVAGVELDVMISAGGLDGTNGTLFVMHDSTLERTTNIADIYPDLVKTNPANLNISQLRNLDAGSWFINKDPFGTVSSMSSAKRDLIKTQKVALFSEVLEIAKNSSKIVMFDTVLPPIGHKHYNDTFLQIINTIKESGIPQSLIYWLGPQKVNNSTVLTQNFTKLSRGADDITYLKTNNISVVNLINGAASVDQLREYKQHNISTMVYLVNTAWLFSYYWCTGVSFVCTDFIADLVEMESPQWTISPNWYKVLWVAVDILSAIVVVLIFALHRYKNHKHKFGPEQVSLNSNSTRGSWGRRHSRRSMKEKLILKDVPSHIYDFEPDEDLGISSNGYDATVTLEDGRQLAQAFRASYHSNMSEGNNSVLSVHDINRNSQIDGSLSEHGDPFHSNRSSYHSNIHVNQTEEATA